MTEILYWLAVVPILLFAPLYAVLARWWETPQGRYNMTLSVALIALATPSLLGKIFGNYPARQYITDVALATVALAVWWRLFLLVRVQVVERRDARRRTSFHED